MLVDEAATGNICRNEVENVEVDCACLLLVSMINQVLLAEGRCNYEVKR